ncbi:MAG: ribonuclease HII [Rhodobacteraceae bacterium]|jgi:ribonuclease HII|nr:ribonuclease HII [Paracoccaceae bacterium]
MPATTKTPATSADFTRETAALAGGAIFVVGVDEVGRGPLAGPVTAAAVRLDPARIPPGLADSKTLTAARRERLSDWLLSHAACAIAHASVEEIDRLNILRASHLAMSRAVAQLPADFALIDGNRIPPGLPCPAEAVVKGDATCLSIAAASIIAKVARDRIMVDLAQQHPGYGWDRNAGYPTKAHLQALLDLGPTPWHRRSFAPVHNILCQAISITS